MQEGRKKRKIASPKGKLGVLVPGIGAVGTTLMAGTFSIRKGLSLPIGSLTQMGTIRLGKRTGEAQATHQGFRSHSRFG